MSSPPLSTARPSAAPLGDHWIARLRPSSAGAVRLVCLPHAGGGAATFRGWGALLPDAVEPVALRLPGRESRLREPPLRSMTALVAAIRSGLADVFEAPYALLGYCSGALVAFELARALDRAGRPPRHLFVVACPAPAHVVRDDGVHQLSGPALAAHLRPLGLMPTAVVDDPALMALFEPAIRADYEVFETAPSEPGPALDVPVTVFGADGDPSTSPSTLLAWHQETCTDFTLQLHPGDHAFFHERREAMTSAITRALTG